MRKALCLSVIITLWVLCGAWTHAADAPFVVSIGPDGVQKVEIVAGSYFFKPDHISVKANHPVEITIRKESSLTPHNFVLNAPEAGMDFREELSSEPRVISFTPTKAGKYEFYCDKKLPLMKSHREKGMKGILEVTP